MADSWRETPCYEYRPINNGEDACGICGWPEILHQETEAEDGGQAVVLCDGPEGG